MIELTISSSLRKRSIEEEKVIIQAAGASKGGNNSLGEMLVELVAEKFEECKTDPNQFNAPYAYAKTRHMQDRYNYLLAVSESEKDLEEEMKRIFSLTTVKPVVLMSQYFAIQPRDRFSWAGRLACVESTLMYDTMQIMIVHPGATLEEYQEKLADPASVKLLIGLESTYNKAKQETPPSGRNERESGDQKAKSTSSSGGGCMVLVSIVAFLMYLASSFLR